MTCLNDTLTHGRVSGKSMTLLIGLNSFSARLCTYCIYANTHQPCTAKTAKAHHSSLTQQSCKEGAIWESLIFPRDYQLCNTKRQDPSHFHTKAANCQDFSLFFLNHPGPLFPIIIKAASPDSGFNPYRAHFSLRWVPLLWMVQKKRNRLREVK